MLQYDEYGEADEEFLDECNIQRDIGPRGEEILRDSSAAHLRRATVMNHHAIVEKRNAEIRKNRLAKLHKMEEENTKHEEKVVANREAVYKLLKEAEEKGYLHDGDCLSDENHLECCSLDTFDALKLADLTAFIIAHDDTLKRKKDIPNRGNLKEAKEHGVNNAILMAYNCRMKPNLLEGKQPHTAEDLARFADEDDDERESSELNVTTVQIGEEEQVLPSELLSCNMWRANAVRLFNLDKRDGEMRIDPGAEATDDMKRTADRLGQILRLRFKVFRKERIRQKSRRDHWSMNFAFNNIPVVAAVMVLSGHLKSDIECLNERDSLLITDSGCFVKCSETPDQEGAYLYFDMVRRVFVRSGKVAGRGFVSRGDEHVAAAKAARPSSTLYRLYPSKDSPRANKKRKGHFESLSQVVAAGFDAKSEQADMLDKDYKNGGVFIMTEEEVKLIKSSMKNLNCSAKVKFTHMLAYQMELGYDLALSPDDVVSGNPGFESVLGVF